MSKFKYKEPAKQLTLLKGIANIHPYQVTLPDAPEPEKIINYGLHPDEQFFQRVTIPQKILRLNNVPRDQAIAIAESDPEMVEFIELMWHKRINGEWQYINGLPTYIPPTYWFYLNFWHLDVGLPLFRSDKYHNCSDLEFFYCWDLLVVPSKFSYGMIELAGRRRGKTYRMGCILYEAVSRNYEWHAGLQSKTNEDAEKAFIKAIIKPWRKLPWFFVPEFSNSTFPKKEGLNFSPKGRKGSELDAADLADRGELMGTITYASSESAAYDGSKIHRKGDDEIGKVEDGDVYERWNINKFCLIQDGQIIGKSFQSTTVEDISKKGVMSFKRLWDDSNRSPVALGQNGIKVDENGETISGLWQWFTPAYCNEVFDQFGVAIVDDPTEKQKKFLKERGDKYWQLGGKDRIDKEIDRQTNQMKKQEIIRKLPRTIEEAFRSASSFSYFNKVILEQAWGRFLHGYPFDVLSHMKFGRFRWKAEFGGEVEFVETDYDNARCHVAYMPPEGMRNLRTATSGGLWKPANTAKFRSGADPFKYDTPDVRNPSKMSDGAQHIYAFYDDQVDGNKPERKHWLTNNFVYEYLYRPTSKDELFEDYLMACIFYGCALYPERNNAEVLDYFRSKGFKHYIQHGYRVTTSLEAGIHLTTDTVGGAITNDKTIQSMFRHVENFVNNDVLFCPFWRTIRDIMDVDRENLNPHDLFVSASYTLMASYEADIANAMLPQKNSVESEVFEALWN